MMKDKAIAELSRGCDEILPLDALRQRLTNGRPLRIKAGFDPTAADLHLGHTVLLNKLRQFQDMGHEVIFLIGDFTAAIGDPSGRDVTRQALTKEQIHAYADTYQQQVAHILDVQKSRIVYNSTWLTALGSAGLIRLAAQQTVAQMLEREDFSRRYKQGQAIALHEFLYPIMQAYDSVALKADVELGGSDQRFNLLLGRELQKQHQQPPQIVLTMPLLEGLDGVRKMSKSYGNYIALEDPPEQMFGKLMSISDTLMWRYFELLSQRSNSAIAALKKSMENGSNPRDIKLQLGMEITTRCHNKASAEKAQHDFLSRFRDRCLPDNAPVICLAADAPLPIARLLKEAGLTSSTSESLRMLRQRAVRIDGERTEDAQQQVALNSSHLYQVGKRRYAKIALRKSESSEE